MLSLSRIASRHSAVTTAARPRRGPELLGQTVVVLGGSAGIGLDIARRVRAAGADVILTGSDAELLERAALEIGARSTAAFDAGDVVALKRFFDGLPAPVDHVLLAAAAGEPDALALAVARNAAGRIRPGGTLLLANDVGRSFARTLALAMAPIHVGVDRMHDTPERNAVLAVDAMADATRTAGGSGSRRLARAA